MRYQQHLRIFPLLIAVVLFGFACSSAQPEVKNTQPAKPEPKLTKISKDALKARLAGKKVQFIEKAPENERPNPLFLMIKIVGSGASGNKAPMVKLNGENGQETSKLVDQLRSIFKMREDQGVFIEGKNEVDKRVNIAAGDADIEMYNKENIYVEDFERLIDDLQKSGIDQIYVNFVSAVRELKLEDLGTPPTKK
ncbi:MAG: hypothetical protein K1X36_13755 [Pyrinomonadaceae bacterium]|nr:hypothetical protein [Pyrinomonadaceae bacterium]